MTPRVSFSNTNPDFSSALKNRVHEYFKSSGMKERGNTKLYFKTVILFSTAITTYLLLLFASLPAWAALPLCVLMGANLAAIGFNVMHDGGHGSYSNKHWVNEIMAYSLNLMGGSSFMWKQKHNVNHHTYTNVEGIDDDIDIQPWIRTNINQPRRWFHRYQHIYWALLYGFTYLIWVFMQDFRKYFSGRMCDDNEMSS